MNIDSNSSKIVFETDVISPAIPALDPTSIQALQNCNDILEDLMESLERFLNDCEKYPNYFENVKTLNKEAGFIIKQAPKVLDQISVEAYVQKVELFKNSATEELISLKAKVLEHKINHVKNRNAAIAHILRAQTKLKMGFAELKATHSLFDELTEIINTRLEFWTTHENQTYHANDFAKFNEQTSEQMLCDYVLLEALRNEVTLAKSQNISVRKPLEILSFIKEHDHFATGQFSELELKKAKTEIMNTLLNARKNEDRNFIDSLSVLKNEFNKTGYKAISEFYHQNSREFTKLANDLSLKTAPAFSAVWDEKLAKFDAEHQLYLKLRNAEKKIDDVIKFVSLDKCSKFLLVSEDKLKELSNLERKAELQDKKSIENYVTEMLELLKSVEQELPE